MMVAHQDFASQEQFPGPATILLNELTDRPIDPRHGLQELPPPILFYIEDALTAAPPWMRASYDSEAVGSAEEIIARATGLSILRSMRANTVGILNSPCTGLRGVLSQIERRQQSILQRQGPTSADVTGVWSPPEIEDEIAAAAARDAIHAALRAAQYTPLHFDQQQGAFVSAALRVYDPVQHSAELAKGLVRGYGDQTAEVVHPRTSPLLLEGIVGHASIGERFMLWATNAVALARVALNRALHSDAPVA